MFWIYSSNPPLEALRGGDGVKKKFAAPLKDLFMYKPLKK